MKQSLKRLYDVPVLGYALRLVVGLVRLPTYLRAHDDALRNIHGWLQQADPKVARVDSETSRLAGQVESLLAIESDLRRIATEAHSQATYLTGAHESAAHRLSLCEKSLTHLQTGLDRHVPTVLGLVSSSGAATRELQRDQQSLKHRLEALVAKLDSIQKGENDAARELERRVGLAEGRLSQTDSKLDSIQKGASDAARELERRVGLAEGRLSQADLKLASLHDRVDPATANDGTVPETQASFDQLRGAVEELRGHVSYLLHRVEFVRRETLFELRYGGAPSASKAQEVEPRIVDGPKVAKALREGLRINVGCGHIPIERYVNVDVRELPGVDVIAEAGRMPFDPASVVELYSAHLVEHFPREQLRREILPYWKSLLAPGGTFRSVVPDAATMIDKYKRGEMSWEDLREVTFGGQDYAGDFHYDMFTPDSLKSLLEEAGFRDVSFPVTGRANGQCYEMEVNARA